MSGSARAAAETAEEENEAKKTLSVYISVLFLQKVSSSDLLGLFLNLRTFALMILSLQIHLRKATFPLHLPPEL